MKRPDDAAGTAPHLAAEFFRTFVDLRQLPLSHSPEVAFVGRSNAGKSSLLNALLSRKDIARTSGMPGKTQALNYFTIHWKTTADENEISEMCFFVDLPGYGYAKVSRALREQFRDFIHGYVAKRKQLRAIVLVCDCRRGPEEDEEEICRLRRDVPVFLALTKVDKLSGNERGESKQRWNQLRPRPARTFFCSSKNRSDYEMDLLRTEVLKVAQVGH